jgi:ElaB/YqjD/DUF883 family membrane-anchored ribosome-binding protein
MTSYSTRSASAGWLTNTISRNPEGLLLLAAGCALLMRKAGTARVKEGRDFGGVHRREENGYGRVESAADEGRSLRETIADTARSAGEYASDVSDNIKENVSSYASTVSDYADQASQSTGRIARQAGSALQSSAQNILQQQPLAVAVAGFAVGAAVAATFPPTEIERRNLGPTGERLKDAALQAGEQIKGAGVQAKEKLASVAEEHGLTAEGLKDMAQQVGDAFSQALSDDQTRPAQNGQPRQQPSVSSTTRPGGLAAGNQSKATGQTNPSSRRGAR